MYIKLSNDFMSLLFFFSINHLLGIYNKTLFELVHTYKSYGVQVKTN